jgi:hypothetical protein
MLVFLLFRPIGKPRRQLALGSSSEQLLSSQVAATGSIRPKTGQIQAQASLMIRSVKILTGVAGIFISDSPQTDFGQGK